MNAKLIVGGKVRRVDGQRVNDYVRTVQAAFRMQATINEDVRVELVDR